MFSTNASTRRARVKYEYAATEDNQLTISKGQEIDLIGDVTSEGWILARNSNGDEGYIPDKYFEIISSKAKPPRPPPLPSTTASTQGTPYRNDSTNSNNKVKQSRMMSEGDEYGLFAYQYEWFAVGCLYIGSILSFLYSTTQPDSYRVYFILLGIVSTLVTTGLLGMISIFRTQCNICNCGTVGVRAGLFILNGILLIPSPVGVTVVAVAIVAAIIEFQVIKKDIKELPTAITGMLCILLILCCEFAY